MQNYLFTSDIFRGSRYEKGHPLDMDRVWPSVELIRLMGWINENQIIKNSPAEISELIKFHDLDYVKALKRAEEDQLFPINLRRNLILVLEIIQYLARFFQGLPQLLKPQ